MAVSLEWAYKEIRKIQDSARSGKPLIKPRWPMIVMRTPKGWTGPKEMNQNPIEGSWRAHQGELIPNEHWVRADDRSPPAQGGQ
jgi:xylulose-5-phosphate/fructose-6-phosphate phosphoketolase